MSDWHDATISWSGPSAQGLFLLRLDVRGTPLVGGHTHPGQYVKLALPGHRESFFAIASAPNPTATSLDLLIKRGAPLPDALEKLPPGSKVQLSKVGGRGFPLDAAKNRRVLLFATGSGISPIRSALEVLKKERPKFEGVTLYFGVRTPDGFAYDDELRAFEREGLKVVRTVSQPGTSGWTGLTGYVQAHVGPEKLDDAVAYLCGQKAMVEAVTEVLVSRGLPKSSVYLNF